MVRPPRNEIGFSFGIGLGSRRSPGPALGRERLARGHLTMIVLDIINEEPRHGYDVMRAIAEKCYGFYAPSPGSVYPILQALDDQGFVTSSTESGKKIYTITAEGKRELQANKDRFARMRDQLRERFRDMPQFRNLMGELNETMHFALGRMRERGIADPETTRKLRVAMVNFKSEIEAILCQQKKGG